MPTRMAHLRRLGSVAIVVSTCCWWQRQAPDLAIQRLHGFAVLLEDDAATELEADRQLIRVLRERTREQDELLDFLEGGNVREGGVDLLAKVGFGLRMRNEPGVVGFAYSLRHKGCTQLLVVRHDQGRKEVLALAVDYRLVDARFR